MKLKPIGFVNGGFVQEIPCIWDWENLFQSSRVDMQLFTKFAYGHDQCCTFSNRNDSDNYNMVSTPLGFSPVFGPNPRNFTLNDAAVLELGCGGLSADALRDDDGGEI